MAGLMGGDFGTEEFNQVLSTQLDTLAISPQAKQDIIPALLGITKLAKVQSQCASASTSFLHPTVSKPEPKPKLMDSNAEASYQIRQQPLLLPKRGLRVLLRVTLHSSDPSRSRVTVPASPTYLVSQVLKSQEPPVLYKVLSAPLTPRLPHTSPAPAAWLCVYFDFALTLVTQSDLVSATLNGSATITTRTHKVQNKAEDLGSSQNGIPNAASMVHAVHWTPRFQSWGSVLVLAAHEDASKCKPRTRSTLATTHDNTLSLYPANVVGITSNTFKCTQAWAHQGLLNHTPISTCAKLMTTPDATFPHSCLSADLTVFSTETPGFFPRKSMTRDGQDLNIFEPQPNINITWLKCQFGFRFTSFLSITLSSLLLTSTHLPTHSLSLQGYPTRSPLSDRITNAHQLVTCSLVGHAFPRLMSFVLHHASATPPVTPSPRVYLSHIDTGRDVSMWSPLTSEPPLSITLTTGPGASGVMLWASSLCHHYGHDLTFRPPHPAAIAEVQWWQALRGPLRGVGPVTRRSGAGREWSSTSSSSPFLQILYIAF
ncbi:hypothetical protein H4582DRAFT_2054151 [Lactarius indigo]|nr:hypothetical protein H4582DRAFT_2054151 [Lactarius indigo]